MARRRSSDGGTGIATWLERGATVASPSLRAVASVALLTAAAGCGEGGNGKVPEACADEEERTRREAAVQAAEDAGDTDAAFWAQCDLESWLCECDPARSVEDCMWICNG